MFSDCAEDILIQAADFRKWFFYQIMHEMHNNRRIESVGNENQKMQAGPYENRDFNGTQAPSNMVMVRP